MKLIIERLNEDKEWLWDSTVDDTKWCDLQAANYMYVTYAGKAGESVDELEAEHNAYVKAFLYLLSKLGVHIDREVQDES